MTLQELIDYCDAEGISRDTHIAMRAKDDYLLVPERIELDFPYFGNCEYGDEVLDEICPRDDDGERDYDNSPDFIILNTGRG